MQPRCRKHCFCLQSFWYQIRDRTQGLFFKCGLTGYSLYSLITKLNNISLVKPKTSKGTTSRVPVNNYKIRCTSLCYPAYQYFAVDTLSQRQPLEDLAEQLEHLGCVLGLDLPFKSIHLVHVVGLMVSCRHTLGYCILYNPVCTTI